MMFWLRCSQSRVVVTEYVARHELCDLQETIQRFENAKLLKVESVSLQSPAGQLYRQLRKTADKGEAEAVAWAVYQSQPPVFVSCDAGARRLADEHRVPNTDVMGVVVEAVLTGSLSREKAKDALEVWMDRSQELGRPANYRGFDEEFATREAELDSGRLRA
jgi:predicted nucleic acid-binding protein